MNDLKTWYTSHSARLLVLCLFCFSSFSLLAQAQIEEPKALKQETRTLKSCATPPKTDAQKRYTLDVIDKNVSTRNNGTTCIPIRAHIVTDDSGNGGISLGDINIGLSYLNSFYLEAGIEFYLCSQNIINSSAWYNFDDSEEAALTAAHSVYDAVNIYFVDNITFNGGGACGYAYFPSSSTVTLNILMDNGCTVGNANGTLVHELGHFFDLGHTHADTEFGNLDPDAEHVPRSGANSNCTTDGDLLCDTAADPNGSNDGNCNFVNDGIDTQDVFGNTYDPDINNVMSYYSDACGGIFTAGQYGRIEAALIERQGYGTYDLDGCAPSVVTNPSGLTATLNNAYAVDLAWMDNANNELGYLIERSQDGGTTWAAVIGGGVGPDVTAYTDNTVAANTMYQYRVKASNDDCNDYSATASIDIGLIYCVPSHQSNSCTQALSGTLGVAIYNFELQESGTALIDNEENGCSQTLSIFTSAHSADVTAGEDYDVVVNFQLGSPPSGAAFDQFVTVWVDANQNGDFSDAGEMLYQSPSASGPTVTAPITIPATATAGATTLRVRTGWISGGQLSDPCAFHPLGEAEDYGLVILNPLPVELTGFEGKLRDKKIALNWQTESETDNDYFLVEKSTDARNFETLGTIQGGGTTLSPQQYDLMDFEPAVGVNYYRLTQFDYDGTFKVIDKIVAVRYQADGQVAIQPNPVKGNQIQLIYETEVGGDLKVDIYNATGQLVKQLDLEVAAARNLFDISLNGLNNGVYVVRTRQGAQTQSLRFVKVN